jgi:hypothetical protein
MLQSRVDDSRGILAVRPPGDEPESPSQWNEWSARGGTARADLLVSVVFYLL